MTVQARRHLASFPLRTARLILRPVVATDAAHIHAQFTPEVALYMVPSPAKQLLEVEDLVVSWILTNHLGLNLQLTITDSAGEFLGLVGVHRLHTTTPELGLWFKTKAQHRGYGSEVVLTLKKWIDEHLEYTYLSYPVDIRNYASGRLVQKLGGVPQHHSTYRTEDGRILEIIEHRIYPE